MIFIVGDTAPGELDDFADAYGEDGQIETEDINALNEDEMVGSGVDGDREVVAAHKEDDEQNIGETVQKDFLFHVCYNGMPGCCMRDWRPADKGLLLVIC